MAVRFIHPSILVAVAALWQTFLLSLAPIQANTRRGDQSMHAGYWMSGPKNIQDRQNTSALPSEKPSITFLY